MTRTISYDPPGAIGLIDSDPMMALRFTEPSRYSLPQDDGRVCRDFGTRDGLLNFPDLADGVVGQARFFSGDNEGLFSSDIEPGATVSTRDVSIQFIAKWNSPAQNAVGSDGVIIVRGTGASSAERVSYGLLLRANSAMVNNGSIHMFWQDAAGSLFVQDGPTLDFPDEFTMITATRRWVSSTEVRVNYYIGGEHLAEVISINGDIGGGTTGSMQVGYWEDSGTRTSFLVGTVDEIMLVGRELCAEEIEATWLRITRYQPLGEQLFREMLDEGFPITRDPSSDVQLDIRMTGQFLGFAAAGIENLRANFLPARAYGTTLEEWQDAVHVSPKPAQGFDERRARVESRLRQKLGISIPGVKDALSDLVDCNVDDLEFIAYDNTIIDTFDTTVEPLLWDMTPTGCATAVAGKARIALGAGTFLMNGGTRNWRTIARSVSQSTLPGTFGHEHAVVRLGITVANNAEAGLWFGDKSAGNYVMIGLRQDSGWKVITETFVNNASSGFLVRQTLGGDPGTIWFQARAVNSSSSWELSWSITGESIGLTHHTVTAPSVMHWCGCYARTIGAAVAFNADFDDFKLRTPYGTSPFNAYVLRDDSLGGNPDIEGARSVIRAIKHGYTHATVITSRAMRAGIDGCGLGPCGVP